MFVKVHTLQDTCSIGKGHGHFIGMLDVGWNLVVTWEQYSWMGNPRVNGNRVVNMMDNESRDDGLYYDIGSEL